MDLFILCISLHLQSLKLFVSGLQDGLRRLSGNEYILSTKREFTKCIMQLWHRVQIFHYIFFPAWVYIIYFCTFCVFCSLYCSTAWIFKKNNNNILVPFFPFLFIWIPPLSCLPFPHRAPPSPQSPDNSFVVKRHPPSNRPDHGEWGLLGLWHFQLGGGDPETVRLNLFNAAGLICVFFGGEIKRRLAMTACVKVSCSIIPQASDLLGPEDLLPLWGLWVPKLPWSHFALLATSHWSELPLE